MSRIHQLNWCKYVLEELVIGVREAVRGAKYVRGCIVLLAIVYFHLYIKRGSKLSNELPLIEHWNDQMFEDSLKREDAAGGLGHSDCLDVVFPISRKHSSESSSLPSNPVGNVRHIVVDLPDDIRIDEEVHSSSIDDVHELLLLIERDSELFYKRTEQLVATPYFFTSQVIQKVDEYVNELSDVDQDTVEKEKAPQSPLIEDYVKEHTIEESPISLEDILKDAEAVMAESADFLINAATRGDEVLEDNKDFHSIYLLHSELDEGVMSVVPKTFGCSIDCGEVNEQMVVLSKTMISAKHVFNPMQSLRKQAADYCFLDDCDIPLSDNIVIWGTNNKLTKEDMETMIPDKMIMLGVIEWWSLFLNDTCITVDLSRLFFGLAQMQPLVRICSPTKDEKTPKSVLVDEVKSAFLSFIRNNKKQCDLNSDMIFIPLHLGDHFSCLCINFIKRKVEYLDNVYKKLLFYGKDSKLGMYCHTVQDMIYSLLYRYDALSPAEETTSRLFASWDTFINFCY
ncbi:hypothetical protein KSS87_011060, partial [Heliosperma pusillum]